jgi:perosamine synthetase
MSLPELIPVNQVLLDGNEKKYLNQCIESGWISSEGPFVLQFEEQFAARMGRKHGIAVSNGSVALDLAVSAFGLGPGDEVIMPTFTIISCAAAVLRAGARPVLVDSDPMTWNMQAEQVRARLTSRTKAIMLVHIFGLPVDADPIRSVAAERGIPILEDAAEMHGQTYKGRPCGGLGEISTFSFYSNKHVTTGEGGMILTDDERLAEKCRSFRNLCFQRKKRFVHEDLGWNFRMSNLQAALGVAQLERLDEFVSRKRRMGKLYTGLLADVPGLQLPLASVDYAENIYWVYGLLLEERVAFDAEEAMRRLRALGVETRPFFWPMHEQPVFQRQRLFTGERYPVSERLARRGFYLPSGLGISEAQIAQVAASVRSVFA